MSTKVIFVNNQQDRDGFMYYAGLCEGMRKAMVTTIILCIVMIMIVTAANFSASGMIDFRLPGNLPALTIDQTNVPKIEEIQESEEPQLLEN